MVYSHFMDGGIAGQIGFMNSAIRSQEITQTCPAVFIGVDMDFTNAVSIVNLHKRILLLMAHLKGWPD